MLVIQCYMSKITCRNMWILLQNRAFRNRTEITCTGISKILKYVAESESSNVIGQYKMLVG